MAVGAYLGPKHVVVAFTKGTHQAGQPDERQIEPTKKLAIGGMAKLMHTNLVAKNIRLSFAVHPRASPQVDESTQRHAHTIATTQFRHEGDAAQGIDTVDLTSQSPSYRIKPSHKGLWQFPSEPSKKLPYAAQWRTFIVGQEEALGELGNETKSI